MRKFAIAVLAALPLASFAMTAKEYAEFRNLINKVTKKVDSVWFLISSMSSDIDGYADNMKWKVETIAEKYTPSRWEDVKDSYEEKKETMDEWKKEIDRLENSCRSHGTQIDFYSDRIRSAAQRGMDRGNSLDLKVSRNLAALATVPFDRLATQEDLYRGWGVEGLVNFEGRPEETFNIEFRCACVYSYPDEEYDDKVKEANRYLELALRLYKEFESISNGEEIPE